MSPLVVGLVLTLVQELPSLYAAVQGDISAVQSGDMTLAVFESKWTDMHALYVAAKAKWTAAGNAAAPVA